MFSFPSDCLSSSTFYLFVLSNFNVIALVLAYYILHSHILLCLRSLFFLMGDQKGVDLERRCGKVKGGGTLIRIYYVRKMSIFNKK